MLTEKLNLNPADLQKQDNVKKHLTGFFRYGRVVEYGVAICLIICIIYGLEYSLESLSSHSHHLGLIRLAPILEYTLFIVEFFAVYAIECTNKTLKPEYQVSTELTTIVKWLIVVCGILNCLVEVLPDDPATGGMKVLFGLFAIALIVILIIWVKKMYKKWSQVGTEYEQVAKLARRYVFLQIWGLAAMIFVYMMFLIIVIGDVPEYAMDRVIDEKDNNIINLFSIYSAGVSIYFYALFPEYYQKIIDVCSPLINTGKTNEKIANASCSSCRFCQMSKDGLSCSLTHSGVDFSDSCANFELDKNL